MVEPHSVSAASNSPVITSRLAVPSMGNGRVWKKLSAAWKGTHSLIKSVASVVLASIKDPFLHIRYSKRLGKSEREEIALLGEVLSGANTGLSSEEKNKSARVIERVFKDPNYYNKRIGNILKLAQHSKLYRKRFKPNERVGLEFLESFSHKTAEIGKLKDLPAVTEKMRNACERWRDGASSLTLDEKLTQREVYLIYDATQFQHLSERIKQTGVLSPISPFLKKIEEQKEFFSHSQFFIDETWKNLKVNNRSILLFREDKFVRSRGARLPLFRSLRKLVRGGEHLHSSMVYHPSNLDRPYQTHVTDKKYEVTPLRFIEFVASDFYTLDAKDFVNRKHLGVLKDMWGVDEDTAIRMVNEQWSLEFEKIREESRDWNHISNTTMRKAMAVLQVKKHLIRQVKPEDFKLDNKKKLICSEYVLLLVMLSIDRVNRRLSQQYQKSGSLEDISFIGHTFDPSVNPSGFRPGDIARYLDRKGIKPTPCSKFFEFAVKEE